MTMVKFNNLYVPVGSALGAIITVVTACIWVSTSVSTMQAESREQMAAMGQSFDELRTELVDVRYKLDRQEMAISSANDLRKIAVDNRLHILESFQQDTERTRWRLEDMEGFVRELKALNPDMQIPDVRKRH